ncbi:hypothetical protein Tco_0009241 [Tanacetum coccineum]
MKRPKIKRRREIKDQESETEVRLGKLNLRIKKDEIRKSQERRANERLKRGRPTKELTGETDELEKYAKRTHQLYEESKLRIEMKGSSDKIDGIGGDKDCIVMTARAKGRSGKKEEGKDDWIEREEREKGPATESHPPFSASAPLEEEELMRLREILEDDYDRGCRKPSDLEDGFYRDTIKLRPEYLDEKDDEGEVT